MRTTEFNWTDENVHVFTQVYCGNYTSLEDKYPMLSPERYHKLKYHEKVDRFKKDWVRIKKMNSIEVVEAIETLRQAGFKVEAIKNWD